MARLYRPYVPLKVRLIVAERQCDLRGINSGAIALLHSGGDRLKVMLNVLFGDSTVALDHDPALVNRIKRKVIAYDKKTDGVKFITRYSPDANDPRFLIYREAGKPGDGSDHDIKTRVRGEHGQHSDLALARKEKRRAKKRAKPGAGAKPKKRAAPASRPNSGFDSRDRGHFRSSVNKSAPKRKWPSRPFPKMSKR